MNLSELQPDKLPTNLLYQKGEGFMYVVFWDLMVLVEFSFTESFGSASEIYFSIFNLLTEPYNRFKAPEAELSLDSKNPKYDVHGNSRTFDVAESEAKIKGRIDFDGKIELELGADFEHKISFEIKEDAHEYLNELKLIVDRIYWEASEINPQIVEDQDLTSEDNPYKDDNGWEDYSKEHTLDYDEDSDENTDATFNEDIKWINPPVFEHKYEVTEYIGKCRQVVEYDPELHELFQEDLKLQKGEKVIIQKNGYFFTRRQYDPPSEVGGMKFPRSLHKTEKNIASRS